MMGSSAPERSFPGLGLGDSDHQSSWLNQGPFSLSIGASEVPFRPCKLLPPPSPCHPAMQTQTCLGEEWCSYIITLKSGFTCGYC